jgi:hypothetical protein
MSPMEPSAPRDPSEHADAQRMAEAETSFARGDHTAVRHALATLRETSDEAVRERAKALHHRVAVDPAQGWVLTACLALFAVIVYLYALG